jgi:hypothetical protein
MDGTLAGGLWPTMGTLKQCPKMRRSPAASTQSLPANRPNTGISWRGSGRRSGDEPSCPSAIPIPSIRNPYRFRNWVTLERLCCPFLNFLIEIDSAGAVRLTVRGPKGVKEVLEEEFPADL